MEKRVLNTDEAMQYTGFKNRNAFFEHIKTGQIKSLNGYGRSRRFDRFDLDNFIEEMKKEVV